MMLPVKRSVATLASIAVGALALALAAPRTAAACGAAYPGGPSMCDSPRADIYRAEARDRARAEAEAARGPTARLSASYGYTSTVLLFGDGRRADLTRSTVFGGVELPLGTRTSLQIGAGGVAGGSFDHGHAKDEIGPGFAGAVGVAHRIYDGAGPWPFVQLSATISGTHLVTQSNGFRTDGTALPAGARAEAYNAFDLRAAVVAGKTIGGVFTPYAVGRVFGGPAYWHFDGAAVTGTDLHKYQVGGGLSLALFDRKLDVFAEGVPLGEAGFAAGVGATFF